MDLNVFRDISYGMYVVTTKTNKNVGCFINTLMQITSENPTISICLNKDNYTNECIKEKKRFAVSILEECENDKIISTFGYSSSRDLDKFKDIKYEYVYDMPVVVQDMNSYLICDLVNVIDCGSHDLFIGKVVTTKKLNDKQAMTYKYYHEVLKGTAPKKAPTYIDDSKEGKSNANKYRCKICGYIYDDAKEKVKFEDLPDDWTCPRCKVGKDLFEKI